MEEDKINIRISETVSPENYAKRKINIEKSKIFIEQQPVKLGHPFNFSGRYLDPGKEYKAYVKRDGSVSDLLLSQAVADETGCFVIPRCVIPTAYKIFFPVNEPDKIFFTHQGSASLQKYQI